MKNCFLLYCCMLVSLHSCTNHSAQKVSSNKTSLVTVEPGVRLELIDWGGKGEPILFLAGLGNSAHIFDEFAPQFADKFHVMAVTRRGFGASSQPPAGYDAATLTKDILTLIDSLKIERITLIGHSIAGEELTKFAELYPARLNKLIYLDAAYDRTDMRLFSLLPPLPPMTKADSTSLSSHQKYLKRVYGVVINESELKATDVYSDDGRFIRDITPDSIYGAMMRGVVHPAYNAIKTPALAFFALPDSVRELFVYYDQLNSNDRNKADTCFHAFQVHARKQIDLFKKEMVAGQVVELHGAHHYVFKSNPEEVATKVRDFLRDE